MIAVAVSGGVDSLACLLLLRRTVSGPLLALHGLFQADAQTPPGLAQICARLAIPLHIADLRREFAATVIAGFIAEHAAGRTPNPCAICNRQIKFGALWQAARRAGASRLATGHYAQIELSPAGRPRLAAGADPSKDQSYFLSLVSPAALANAIFPLGQFSKTQTRALVAATGLAAPVAKESQDICFLAATGASPFLARHLRAQPGPIMLQAAPNELPRRVGSHLGLWRYTMGQRRGLGIAWREPLYVCGKDIKHNVLLLAPRQLALMRGARVGKLNLLMEPERWPAKIFVKLRYQQKPALATCVGGEDSLQIELAEPQLTTAPGQVAAIYDAAGNVLGGGIVTETKIATA